MLAFPRMEEYIKKLSLKCYLWSGLGEQGRVEMGTGVRFYTLPFYMVLKTLKPILSIQLLNEYAIRENAKKRRPSYFVHSPSNGRDLTVTWSKLIILWTRKPRPVR